MTSERRPFLGQAGISSGALAVGGIVFAARSDGNDAYLVIGVAAAVIGAALLAFVALRWSRARGDR